MSAIAVAVAVAASCWTALGPRRWPWRLAGSFPRFAAAPRSRRRPSDRPRRVRERGQPDAIPRCADLLAVALAAGATTTQALAELGGRDDAPGPLRSAASALGRGNPLDDVLDEIAWAGPDWQSLATTLSLSSGTGHGAPETLRRFAASERLRIRRQRERSARRLPVLLLVPLTTLVLPAFVLATVVPFVVLGENPLRLPPTAPASPLTEGP
ncbi:MAG: type II secretion system F family protein [Microthrixaceae bacterium]